MCTNKVLRRSHTVVSLCTLGPQIGVVEGLLYARKAGLDLTQVIAAVGAGAAGKPLNHVHLWSTSCRIGRICGSAILLY